jgi:hypothetical protein
MTNRRKTRIMVTPYAATGVNVWMQGLTKKEATALIFVLDEGLRSIEEEHTYSTLREEGFSDFSRQRQVVEQVIENLSFHLGEGPDKPGGDDEG